MGWLYALLSMNNPKVIGGYYLDCVKELKLIPRVIRAARGTKNVIICGIHWYFFQRNDTDNQSKDKSFINGHSTANQGIESC